MRGSKRQGCKIGKRWVCWRSRSAGSKAERRQLERRERQQGKTESSAVTNRPRPGYASMYTIEVVDVHGDLYIIDRNEIEPLRLSRRGAKTLANLLLHPPRANQKLRSLFHGDSKDTAS
jgi:hypothetical protein